MLRNKQALLPYLLLVAALAGGLLWHESENVPGLGKSVVTGQADVGGPFKLIDQTGKPVTDADYRGRYMLIYFGYSFCPDVCPTTLAVMTQLCRPDRQRRCHQGCPEEVPRLCREEALGKGCLRHGPLIGAIPDGPERQTYQLL